MKTSEQILDTLYNFTQTQKNTLELISAQLISLKDKKIGLDTLSVITNSFRELDGIRENITIRLLASMKRGDIVN